MLYSYLIGAGMMVTMVAEAAMAADLAVRREVVTVVAVVVRAAVAGDLVALREEVLAGRAGLFRLCLVRPTFGANIRLLKTINSCTSITIITSEPCGYNSQDFCY